MSADQNGGPSERCGAFESPVSTWAVLWVLIGAAKNGRPGSPAGRCLWPVERPLGRRAAVSRRTACCTRGAWRSWRRRSEGHAPPALSHFILATTGPADAIQQRARELTDAHKVDNRFEVDVWDWIDLARDYQRDHLLRRIGPIYWPPPLALRFGLQQRPPVSPTSPASSRPGGGACAARRCLAGPQDPCPHLVAWGGVGKTWRATWAASLPSAATTARTT
jgi:hypothetical protein